MKTLALRAAFLSALVLAWHLAATLSEGNPALLPGPTEVGAWLAAHVADGSLAGAVWVTFRRLALGFAIGLAAGLPLGLLCARSRTFDDTAGMLVRGVQALPSVCWVPLANVWFGLTETAMLFVVVMGTVGSIAVASADGLRSVSPIYLRVARTMGARGLSAWVRVVLPASFPSVLSGMRQGWAFAWRSLMAAEIYVPVIDAFGLGHMLHVGREFHAMDQVMGVMIAIVAVGVTVEQLVFAPLEAALHRRWGTGSRV